MQICAGAGIGWREAEAQPDGDRPAVGPCSPMSPCNLGPCAQEIALHAKIAPSAPSQESPLQINPYQLSDSLCVCLSVCLSHTRNRNVSWR